MRMKKLAGAAFSMIVGAGALGMAGQAAAQANTTVTLTDGTVVRTEILGLSQLRILLTGGPTFGPNPATVNVTSLVPSGTSVLYSGNVVIAGTTTNFNCTVNLSTNAVNGDSICGTAFGGTPATPTPPTTPVTPTPPTTPTTPTPPTTPTTPTPPTTPTTPTTPTPPTTPTTPTAPPVVTNPSPNTVVVTTPTGTITITRTEKTLIDTATLEQFAANLLADRLASGTLTGAVAARVSQLQQIYASGGRLTQNGYTGMSAGDPNGPSSIWATATGSDLKFDYIGAGTEGDQYSFVLGADHRFDTITAGAFGSFSRTKLDGTNAAYEADG
jgi:hypothetical protein